MEHEDKAILYLVIRESLNMSSGKIAAQSGHAIDRFNAKYYGILSLVSDLALKKSMGTICDEIEYNELNELISLVNVWKNNGSTIVALKADEKEWSKLKDLGNNCFVVVDAGRTEVNPNTETCLSIWPMRKSARPSFLKRLQLL